MKKELTYEQALQVLKRGETVECQTNFREDNNEIVRTELRLKYLHDLSENGIQLCKIFKNFHGEVKLPQNAIEISFDKAYEMVYSGKLVYYNDDGEEKKITTTAELIKVRTGFELKGKKLLLYWYE